MQNAAMWLASIFGPFLVILGLWMLLYCDQHSKVVNAFKTNAGLSHINAVLNILVGFTVLSQYDMWGWNLLTLVTLLGWIMVVRGVMGLFAPQMYLKMCTNKMCSKTCGLLPLVYGILLSYVGFFR